MYSSFDPDTYISIHAAREGGDILSVTEKGKMEISIHAAREGGDTVRPMYVISRLHFNPRRP